MTKSTKSNAEKSLEIFWKELFNTPLIPVQKLLDLNDTLFKVLLRVQELTKSRDSWRKRAEKAEQENKVLTTKLNRTINK